MYGASRKNETATARSARRSEVSEWVRLPVNRQMTITAASPSMAEPRPQPTSAMLPAVAPAMTPRTPSTVIQARLSHDSRRARRAARSQRSSRLGACSGRGASGSVTRSLT